MPTANNVDNGAAPDGRHDGTALVPAGLRDHCNSPIAGLCATTPDGQLARKSGPLFLTDRKARVALPPGDSGSRKARLSYRRAAEIFEEATAGEHGGPWTLHQLRHSALTHDAENGASTPMLMAKSGHTSVASLARYA